jgi:hypothetical protein
MKNYRTKDGYLTVPQAEKRAIALFAENGIADPRNIYKRIHHAIRIGELEYEFLGSRIKQVKETSIDSWVLSIISNEKGGKESIQFDSKIKQNLIATLEEIQFITSQINTQKITNREAEKALSVIKKLIFNTI